MESIQFQWSPTMASLENAVGRQGGEASDVLTRVSYRKVCDCVCEWKLSICGWSYSEPLKR